MKTIIRVPGNSNTGQIVLKEVSVDKVVVQEKSIISIDGSTSTTGVAILRESDGAMYYSMACSREKDESPVRYKIRLKNFIKELLLANEAIETVYYEEPCISHISAVSNLFMLRSFVEELIIETEPKLDYIKHAEINNMKWKSLFLRPSKCPPGSELQKKAVRDRLVGYLPFLKEVTQDEIDAIAMGYVATVQIAKGLAADLESRKKARAFKYNIAFAGADEDQSIIDEFFDIYTGPIDVSQNGISLTQLNGIANFDKKVYELMGNDDKVLILKFSSNKYGNLILEHRIGHLAAQYEYLYAIVWRKARKYN